MNAYYVRLYGLTRDELRYAARLSVWIRKKSMAKTLRYAPRALRASFPGETFRVLKEKEIKQFGDAAQSDETSSA